MATQEVRVHTVRINGGMIREMESEQAKLFLEKGKQSRYSDWDYNVKVLMAIDIIKQVKSGKLIIQQNPLKSYKKSFLNLKHYS